MNVYLTLREEASQRIQALTDKAEKDNQQHNIEMKELVRLIDHERKLKQFMKIKAAEREEDPQLTAWRVSQFIKMKAHVCTNSNGLRENTFA